MPIPLPPKPTLRVATAEEREKLMWDGWIDECDQIRDAFVEGLLANLPSLVKSDG